MIRRIAVIGDTGCRLNDWEKKYQACYDPDAWPFAQVAQAVADWDPDLVRDDLRVMAWLAPKLVGRIPIAALAGKDTIGEAMVGKDPIEGFTWEIKKK